MIQSGHHAAKEWVLGGTQPPIATPGTTSTRSTSIFDSYEGKTSMPEAKGTSVRLRRGHPWAGANGTIREFNEKMNMYVIDLDGSYDGACYAARTDFYLNREELD